MTSEGFRTRTADALCLALAVVAVLDPRIWGWQDGQLSSRHSQLVAVALAAFWIARRGAREAVAAGVLVVLSVVAIELQSLPLDRTDVSDVIYVSAPGLLAAATGSRLARREMELIELARLQQRLEAQHAARAARVLAEEKERIGRELHDLVAQAAGAVVAQATAARVLLAQARREEARAALTAVEGSAREGLAEMRVLLGVLRAPAVPAVPT